MSLDAVNAVFNLGFGHLWLIATTVCAAFLVTPWVLILGVLATLYMLAPIEARR